MHQRLHPAIRQRLLANSVDSQWLKWLCLLAHHDSDYKNWQLQGTVSQKALADIDIPVQLPEQVWVFMKQQWQALQDSR